MGGLPETLASFGGSRIASSAYRKRTVSRSPLLSAVWSEASTDRGEETSAVGTKSRATTSAAITTARLSWIVHAERCCHILATSRDTVTPRSMENETTNVGGAAISVRVDDARA